jgi:hypothetical protein
MKSVQYDDNSEVKLKLKRIIHRLEKWAACAEVYEKRILELFGIGDEFEEMRRLTQKIQAMAGWYDEISLLAETEPELFASMHANRQLIYQMFSNA